MRIACCGAGPGGLYFALLARRAGHDVTVFERNAPGLTYGWGVVYWDGLLRTLRSGDAKTADAIRERSFRWSGQTLHVAGRPPVRKPGDGFGIGRRQLLEALGERAAGLGVDLRFEHEVTGVADLADADLVVAADGAGSVLRRELADELAPRVEAGRNRYVWLGTTRVFSPGGLPSPSARRRSRSPAASSPTAASRGSRAGRS
jgi:2-polyprenyl-6-methoxyphenol hydroxylase-like FAD-dependent oxidoreductase